jgi:hypothetical protein
METGYQTTKRLGRTGLSILKNVHNRGNNRDQTNQNGKKYKHFYLSLYVDLFIMPESKRFTDWIVQQIQPIPPPWQE